MPPPNYCFLIHCFLVAAAVEERTVGVARFRRKLRPQAFLREEVGVREEPSGKLDKHRLVQLEKIRF
jgi:hypothetical protein